jgi:integrase
MDAVNCPIVVKRVTRASSDCVAERASSALPEYVFPSAARAARHIAEVRTVWDHIRKAAKLEHVRLHDLRHTFASLGVSHGYTLPLVGALLGHRKASTTMRYAEVALDPQREAMGKLGAIIAQSATASNEEPASAEMLSLKPNKKGSRSAR